MIHSPLEYYIRSYEKEEVDKYIMDKQIAEWTTKYEKIIKEKDESV